MTEQERARIQQAFNEKIKNGQEKFSVNGMIFEAKSAGEIVLYSVNNNVVEAIIPNGVTTIGLGAFNGCDDLTSVTIPNSVTSIGRSAFYGCDGLTSVTISNGVTEISGEAFAYCSRLTSVTIPDGVMSIGKYAFYECSSLTNVTIPDSVMSIGDKAFAGCDNLKQIILPLEISICDDDNDCTIFENCPNLSTIIVVGNPTEDNKQYYESLFPDVEINYIDSYEKAEEALLETEERNGYDDDSDYDEP